MAINFPNSPTNGQTYTVNSSTYTYVSAASSWRVLSSITTSNVYATTIQTQTGAGTIYGTWTLASGATFQATYADLAERYSSDILYDPGTVVVFKGNAEVTLSLQANDRTVAGVVSTNPAYLLNVDIEGVDVALQGRVPCKVVGPIQKGDMMVTSNMPGVAMANNDPKMGTVIGKALEDYASTEVGTIEVAVGRL